MEEDDSENKSLQKVDEQTQIAKLLEIPINAKAALTIAIDREKAEARVKILEADIIIKFGLLHKKKGDNNHE